MAEEKQSFGSSQKKSDSATEPNHYALLGLHPSTSVREIRQAYRDLSKLYHPDTTDLPTAIATRKFQQLNEAYATLSNPERRAAYDLSIGYSRVVVVRPLPSLHKTNKPEPKSSAYIDATDRPLSPGELFALFILGVTFVACLVLAITIGITRGDQAFQPLTAQHPKIQEVQQVEDTTAQGESAVAESKIEAALQPLIAQESEFPEVQQEDNSTKGESAASDSKIESVQALQPSVAQRSEFSEVQQVEDTVAKGESAAAE